MNTKFIDGTELINITELINNAEFKSGAEFHQLDWLNPSTTHEVSGDRFCWN